MPASTVLNGEMKNLYLLLVKSELAGYPNTWGHLERERRRGVMNTVSATCTIHWTEKVCNTSSRVTIE